jgi:hypothetical protein
MSKGEKEKRKKEGVKDMKTGKRGRSGGGERCTERKKP